MPESGADVLAQMRRSPKRRLATRQCFAQSAKRLFNTATIRAGAQMLLGLACGKQIEFAVNVGVNQFANLFVIHGHFVSGFKIICSWRRPRAKRDMMVPIGTPAISAISL